VTLNKDYVTYGCIEDVTIAMEKPAGAGFRLAAASGRSELSGLRFPR
jgi:hypothetical protein